MSHERTTIAREVPAIQIPDGIDVMIPEGEQVWITQELGGSFTVMTDRGAMFRIDEKNADAIGKEPPKDHSAELREGSLEDRVWAQMKKCYDPEIPVNIVDLGLVYDCQLHDKGSDRFYVTIKMTLTAPGCGMGPVLAADVKNRIEDLPEVDLVDVEVVLDPPWNQNMMTEAAKLQLGFM
ncbi:MAG: putative Fe-S cluster assembly protein SufT [bacterium]|nr:putative Fe-S cluster assembly protein SufT [bacterium]